MGAIEKEAEFRVFPLYRDAETRGGVIAGILAGFIGAFMTGFAMMAPDRNNPIPTYAIYEALVAMIAGSLMCAIIALGLLFFTKGDYKHFVFKGWVIGTVVGMILLPVSVELGLFRLIDYALGLISTK